MIFNPDTHKWVYFGQVGYEDFTKHGDQIRRNNYLRRTENIRGDWKQNEYSPNNLSRNIFTFFKKKVGQWDMFIFYFKLFLKNN